MHIFGDRSGSETRLLNEGVGEPRPGSTLGAMGPYFVRRLGLALLLLAALGSPVTQSAASRLVAIGDIHGALERFQTLLQHAGLLDDQQHRSGGSDTLVQTGDFLDCGRDVRAVMDLLIDLEREAAAAGGRVEILLGNHETMNLMANVRDATPNVFASFASADSIQRQQAAYEDYSEFVETRRAALGRPLPDRQTREDWLDAHPVGFVEYMEALGPNGHYGRWLRSKPVAVVVNDTLFLHGGLSLENTAASVSEMVARAQDELDRFDTYRSHLLEQGIVLETSTFPEILAAAALELNAWFVRRFPGPPAPDAPPPSVTAEDREHLDVLFGLQGLNDWSVIDPNGPVWSRDFARWSDEEGTAATTILLDRFGVSRAVVGHSVTATRRITGRFGSRVFLIDTGMLVEAYQGRAAALELTDEGTTAIYSDGRISLALAQP